MYAPAMEINNRNRFGFTVGCPFSTKLAMAFRKIQNRTEANFLINFGSVHSVRKSSHEPNGPFDLQAIEFCRQRTRCRLLFKSWQRITGATDRSAVSGGGGGGTGRQFIPPPTNRTGVMRDLYR